MATIVSGMFVNAAILISFLTFGNYFMREKGVNPSSPLVRKIVVGFVSGISGCLLMLYSVQFAPNILVDFRSIPIIIMALHASFESSLVTALIIGTFRILYFGPAESSYLAFITVIIIAVACGFISYMKLKQSSKWIFSIAVNMFFSGIVYTILLINSSLLDDALLSFFIGTLLVSLVMYFFSQYIEESNSLYRQMKEEIKKDFLTGLNNVRQFDTYLNSSLSNVKEENGKLSILYIDLDYFKKVNDTYGHANGDIVLKELSAILKKNCRNCDVVSRNGGEEFSVILPDCGLEQAAEVAERIRKNVEQNEFVLNTGEKISITVSIGVSSYPQTVKEPEKLVEQADIALYNAKRSGRNAVSTISNYS